MTLRRHMARAMVIAAAWLCAALVVMPAQAQERIRPAYTLEFVAQMLDYVSRDYALAVARGRIIDADEYTEQLVIGRSIQQIGADLPSLRDDAAVHKGIRQLMALIRAKADAGAVQHQALHLRDTLYRKAGMATAPAHWPSLDQGQRVYQAHCAACHGERGDGTGPSGAGLMPPPSNFMDARRMAALSPLSVFAAVRHGIQRTAMPAHPALSDDDIWAVSFHVMSIAAGPPLAHGEKLDATAAALWLKAAATLNDVELKRALPGSTAERRKLLRLIRLNPGPASAVDRFTPPL